MSQGLITSYTEKERLLRVLKGQSVDRPPVICPGGMMNAAVTEVVKNLKDNHNTTWQGMVEAARAVYNKTGFENYGVPFCMTCEAEPFNPNMDEGSYLCEPKILNYIPWPDTFILPEQESQKRKEVIQATLALANDKIPVIGNITGPISTATSIVDPIEFFKTLLKMPEKANQLLNVVNQSLISYAQSLVRSGADVIVLSDPTATGEILGIKYFEQFALPLYEAFSKAMDVPWIIHICGNVNAILPLLNRTGASALSVDSLMSIHRLKEIIDLPLMGNVSTLLLQEGPIERVENITMNALNAGVSIVAPACGLGMSTPIKHLAAMTQTVKKQKRG